MDTLRGGWEAYSDDEGRTYYHHKSTGNTTYDHPGFDYNNRGRHIKDGCEAEAPLDEEAAIGDGHESPPPPGWEMHESEEHPGTLVVLVYTAGIHLIAVGSQRVLLTLHLLAWLLECKQVTTFTKTHRPVSQLGRNPWHPVSKPFRRGSNVAEPLTLEEAGHGADGVGLKSADEDRELMDEDDEACVIHGRFG